MSQAIKINPATFKYLFYNDITHFCIICDIDFFPKDSSKEKKYELVDEYTASYPHCTPFSNKSGDMSPRRLEYKGKFIEYLPGPMGLPNIRDLDVLIFCETWITNAKLDGREEDVGSTTYEFDVKDFYEFAVRPRHGKRDNQFIQGLERLATCRVKTNTRPFGMSNDAFNLIEKFELKRDEAGCLKSVTIELPQAIYHMAYKKKCAPMHHGYFDLPNIRRMIYLFLKQYCVTNMINCLPVSRLYEITGSTVPMRKFLPVINELKEKPLPEFELVENPIPGFEPHGQDSAGFVYFFYKPDDMTAFFFEGRPFPGKVVYIGGYPEISFGP